LAELKNLSVEKEKIPELAAMVDELAHRWEYVGRESQQQPAGDWDTWIIKAGRGFGKTRTGSETIRLWSDQVPSMLLMGATATDLRDIMIEGPSGILKTAPHNNYPVYEPSKLRLTWKNGCVCHIRSAEEPDRIRGIEVHRGWFDEFASWDNPEGAWDMISMSVRLGDTKKLITTTPRRLNILKKIMSFPGTVVTSGATYENKDNLSESFIESIRERYEGTRIGRQEIHAEILDDIEGALWTSEIIDNYRVKKHPDLKRVVVAIDPAVTATKKSDETGIIVAGMGSDNHGYILNDYSGIYTPRQWAEKGLFAYDRYNADRVVAEVNNGGDLVETNIRSVDSSVNYKEVRASRGKVIRAEPVVALYEQGKIHHVGIHDALENQMMTWDPGSEKSPDRVDALVWGLTELMLKHINTNIWA
jgi:phage terminase large subunit-like protein